MGKTITQIVYITDSGYHTIDTSLFVGKKYDGAELKVENGDLSSGKTTFTLTGLPSDFDAQYSIDGLNASISNGVIEFANDTKAGGYTLTVTDKNGVYVPMTANFEITTSGMPAKFNADTNSLEVNDGFGSDEFENFLNNISTITVASGENSKAYSLAQAKIIGENGEIDLNATFEMKGQKTAIFANDGTYTLTVAAFGYSDTITFDVIKVSGASEVTAMEIADIEEESNAENVSEEITDENLSEIEETEQTNEVADSDVNSETEEVEEATQNEISETEIVETAE
jgi:hypothetical protein